jgi:hypothetical protein
MTEYRFLCPKCGHAFAEGTSFKKCPRCQVPLLEASAGPLAELGDLPSEVDLDELLRKVLAEQDPGEDIDRTIKRVVAANYPESEDGLLQLVTKQLEVWEQFRNVSRQQAVQEIAESQSEMVLGAAGQPELRTEFRSEIQIGNLDEFSPQMRAEALRHIQDVLRSGGKAGSVQFGTRIGNRRVGCTTIVIAAAIALGGLTFLC